MLTQSNSDLDQMREQQNTAQTDVQQLSSQTQSMLSLNMKLQQTVSKAQVRSIDLELRKLEAKEAIERLMIIKVRSEACCNWLD